MIRTVGCEYHGLEAALDVELGKPVPATWWEPAWPGDMQAVALRIDGQPARIADHPKLVSRLLASVDTAH